MLRFLGFFGSIVDDMPHAYHCGYCLMCAASLTEVLAGSSYFSLSDEHGAASRAKL